MNSNAFHIMSDLVFNHFEMFLQQSIKDVCIIDDFWNESHDHSDYKSTGVGSGRSKSGDKSGYVHQKYFEQDLLQMNLDDLGPKEFTRKHAGFSANDVEYIWSKIKFKVLRPRETEFHARNKLLLWMDKLHNKLTWTQISRNYHISPAAAIQYVDNLTDGMIESYKNTNIISFPSPEEQEKMTALLDTRNKPMPNCVFNMDGKHAICKGLHIFERLSPKFNFHHACFNVLFVTERVFGTICSFTLDKSVHKSDVAVLRQSTWFQDLEELTEGGVIMADKGYVGAGSASIAAQQKKGSKKRNKFSPAFWSEMCKARSDCERIFSHMFVNKWPQLSMYFVSQIVFNHTHIYIHRRLARYWS